MAGTPEQEHVSIHSLDEILSLGGQVLRISGDSGQTWRYGLLHKNPLVSSLWSSRHRDLSDTVDLDAEVGADGGHAVITLWAADLASQGVILELATAEEAEGKSFSYEAIRELIEHFGEE